MADGKCDGPCDLFPTIMKTFDKELCSKPHHVWSEPVAKNFNVRGAKYLSDRKKIKAPCSQYSLLGIDLILTDNVKNPLHETTERPYLSFARARRRGFKGFVFMINFVASYGNFIIYWTPSRNITSSATDSSTSSPGNEPNDELLPYLTGHPRFDSLMQRFVEEDDEFRNARLKVIPIVVEGNYFLRNFVGKPAIMCNKIETNWTRDLSPEGNYLSADIHLSSSSMAITILGLVRHYVESVTLDMAFTIEGQNEAELPEELLCAMRFHHVDMVNADTLERVEAAWNASEEAKGGDESPTSNAGAQRNGHSSSISQSQSQSVGSQSSPGSAPADLENSDHSSGRLSTGGSHSIGGPTIGGDKTQSCRVPNRKNKGWNFRRKKEKSDTLHSTPTPRPRGSDSSSHSAASFPHSKSDDEIDKSLEADLEAGHP